MCLLTCLCLAVVAAVGLVRADGDGQWGYRDNGNFTGSSDWSRRYRTCGGSRQTPINIQRGSTEYWAALKEVSVTPQTRNEAVTLKKTDLGIYLTFNDGWTVTFSGHGCFRPASIHWHWGSNNGQGSEHTVDGGKYPIEAHLVTYDCNLYNTSEEAMTSPSGLHVFGMFYQVGPENPALRRVTSLLNGLDASGAAKLPEIPPSDFLPQDRGKYFRYEGSLTTPPCTENVIWTLFNQIQTVSEEQLGLFRNLRFGKPESGKMVDNFRPVVALSYSSAYVRRIVYASFRSVFNPIGPSVVVILSAVLSAAIAC